jgi:hypothetical protein
VVVEFAKDSIAVGARGKSSGASHLLLDIGRSDVIVRLYAHPKNAAANLTPAQVSQLAKVVKEEFGNEKADV